MKPRRKTIKSLLKDLKKASKLLDGLCDKVRYLENDLDRSQFVSGIGETLTKIYSLEAELFDLEPTLTYESLKPSLAPTEFDSALERLLSGNSAICHSTIREFQNHMLEEVASEFMAAWESGQGYEFAEAWWHRQRKPFVPVISVYKRLKHGRRYMQYNCAKLLEAEFGVRIWEDKKGELLLDVADKWFCEWLTSYE